MYHVKMTCKCFLNWCHTEKQHVEKKNPQSFILNLTLQRYRICQAEILEIMHRASGICHFDIKMQP